jgi:hypothetical protein
MDGYFDADIVLILLGVLYKNIKVFVVIKDPGIYQFKFAVSSSNRRLFSCSNLTYKETPAADTYTAFSCTNA